MNEPEPTEDDKPEPDKTEREKADEMKRLVEWMLFSGEWRFQ